MDNTGTNARKTGTQMGQNGTNRHPSSFQISNTMECKAAFFSRFSSCRQCLLCKGMHPIRRARRRLDREETFACPISSAESLETDGPKFFRVSSGQNHPSVALKMEEKMCLCQEAWKRRLTNMK